MRIGIDVRVADPSEPGQQRYLWRLGAWLAETGHEIHYLTVKRQNESVSVTAGAVLHRLHHLSRRRVRGAVTDLNL
ncbi:MAG: hypothetical protein GWM92_21400, partial [Gemmatimonadetes bacterium]|nr:hypothetical protein [Gemmatimonadota bacterium]NIT90248.1 hypothetical protein [Gemmatimonadota bacterium]NIU79539.1 hypothetical protein [Gammaproteobacteria bacterium]NIX42381.1 hypothetical protein [Gemmatimonadota bacterium]NIY41883.1 hypothetical protein [Gemmatimonadota bacterium]